MSIAVITITIKFCTAPPQQRLTIKTLGPNRIIPDFTNILD